MSYVLALDAGTTSARAVVFGHDGSVKTFAQREFRQIFPQPGWVEHDAEEIWSAQVTVAVEALSRADLQTRDLVAVGITNQRETTVLWDRSTGKPIHNAIVWQDRRTAPLCQRLRADGCEGLFRERTGLVLDAYFSGTKIAWLLDNVAGARAKAEAGQLAFGTIDTWLAWKLTGGKCHITDPSNASRTLLFNLHTCQWDEELLKLLRVPRAILPEVRTSSEVYGPITSALGLEKVPLAGIAGDQQSALFGQMCIAPGLTKTTYGTGCFMLMNTGTKPVASKNRLLTTVAWRIGQQTEYALEGSVFIGGAVVQWLRDGLGLIKSAEEIETLANSVADNGGVVLVPAFSGLGAPHWDPQARGTIFGITRGTTAAHLARAGLEGIAYQVTDLIQAMQDDAGIVLSEMRVDGGAVRNNLLMQFQADILGVPVVRPAVIETTALGAAYLAGLAVGFWKNRDEIARQWQVERRFTPAMDSRKVLALRKRWQKALHQSMHWETESEA